MRYGNAHPTVVPYQIFEASDGVFALAVGNDRMYADFCHQVIARPDLAADPRFVTSHQRALHREALLPVLADILAQRTCEDWLASCNRASVPAGRVKSVAEALEAPSVTGRGVIQRLDHPVLGPIALIRPAHGLAAQQDAVVKAPPLLGEDTRAVLAGVLGYDAARIDRLVATRVVSCAFDVPQDPATTARSGA